MPAFDLAYQIGADGIETDVQLTKDQVPVLIHDETVNRTTDGVGFIEDYTYNELQTLDAGSWFSLYYRDTKIPTLEDLLAWNQDKHLLLNIELKTNVIHYEDIEQIVWEKVKRYDMINQTVFSSFLDESLVKLRDINQDISYAFLTGRKRKDLCRYGKHLGAKGLHIKYRLLNQQLVEEAKKHQLYVAVYTVNHPMAIRKVINHRCHALFSDTPDIAIHVRNQIQREE